MELDRALPVLSLCTSPSTESSWTHAYSIVPPRSSSPFILISPSRPTFLRFIPHGVYGYVHPLTSDGYRVAKVPRKGRLVISVHFRSLPTTAFSWSSREYTRARNACLFVAHSHRHLIDRLYSVSWTAYPSVLVAMCPSSSRSPSPYDSPGRDQCSHTAPLLHVLIH